MSYIVIETFDDAMYNICSDEEGYTKFFDGLKDAVEECKNCQDGIIIDLDDGKIVISREEFTKIKDMLDES